MVAVFGLTSYNCIVRLLRREIIEMNAVMESKLSELQNSEAATQYRLGIENVFNSSVIPTVASQVGFDGFALSKVSNNFTYDSHSNNIVNNVNVELVFPDEPSFADSFYMAKKFLFVEMFNAAVNVLMNR